MKPWKILLFILLVITTLAIISILFPPEGIAIGKMVLKFPKPEEILVRQSTEYQDPEEILKQWQLQQEDSLKNELKDTLAYYRQAMAMPTKIYFPNDDYTFFDALFADFLSAKVNKRTIRVLHYGDSQIELDRISTNLRSFFQTEFGGGGPGLLPLYQSVATPTVYQSFSGDYKLYALYGELHYNAQKDYGIMAKSFKIAAHNLFSVSSPRNKENPEARERYSSVKLFCMPADTNFKATIQDKGLKHKITANVHSTNSQLVEIKLDTSLYSLNLSLSGQATIYGIILDNGYGIAVDNIAMRGSGGTFFTQMNDSLLAHYYQMLDVGMIILQYGGNAVPSLFGEKSIENYVEKIGEQIRFLKKVAPNVPILFIGPSDMSTRLNGTLTTYKWLPMLVEKLQKCVLENGAAFWNLYEVMGGKNSMLAWVKKGWAGKDYVHFTPQGAYHIGEVLTHSLSVMYQFYNLRLHNPSIHFDEVWNELTDQYIDIASEQAPQPDLPAIAPEFVPELKSHHADNRADSSDYKTDSVIQPIPSPSNSVSTDSVNPNIP